MNRHYDHLKEQPTGTREGLDLLARIYKRCDNKISEGFVPIARILVRARGRVIADLIGKGEITQDEQAEHMRGFALADSLLMKATKLSQAEIIEESFEFIRRHGE